MPDPRPAFLFHPDGSFLARHAGQRPTLTLEMWDDAAKAAREAWGLEVWTLHNGESSPLHLQAVTDGLPQGWAWVREDAPPLPGARRWQRPGWRAEVLGWLAERGVTVQTVRPISTYDLNTILEVHTGEKTLFLKVSESPREAAVTAYLAHTLPELVPPLVAAEEKWLLTESGGALLDSVGEWATWEEAVRRLAHFQRSASGEALAALGCPVVSLSELRERVDALLADTAALEGWGLKPERIATLQAARPQIRQGFDGWAALGLPELPAHGDAHPRNALHGERGAVWFDWSEAQAAAHPFLDFGWFLFFALAKKSMPIHETVPDLETRLTAAYAGALGCPADALASAVPLALLGRAALYDARFRHWEGTVTGWRPQYVPYYLGRAAGELGRLG